MSDFKLTLREDRPATIEEHRALRDEINRLRKENFAFSAGLCPHHYGDEYGHSGCRAIDRLREQLEKLQAEAETDLGADMNWRHEAERLREQLVKRTDALKKIDETISNFEKIMTLPTVKELKEIWRCARAAVTDD